MSLSSGAGDLSTAIGLAGEVNSLITTGSFGFQDATNTDILVGMQALADAVKEGLNAVTDDARSSDLINAVGLIETALDSLTTQRSDDTIDDISEIDEAFIRQNTNEAFNKIQGFAEDWLGKSAPDGADQMSPGLLFRLYGALDLAMTVQIQVAFALDDGALGRPNYTKKMGEAAAIFQGAEANLRRAFEVNLEVKSVHYDVDFNDLYYNHWEITNHGSANSTFPDTDAQTALVAALFDIGAGGILFGGSEGNVIFHRNYSPTREDFSQPNSYRDSVQALIDAEPSDIRSTSYRNWTANVLKAVTTEQMMRQSGADLFAKELSDSAYFLQRDSYGIEPFADGGDDFFAGSNYGDFLNGKGGDDRIDGHAGADVIYGGEGNDILLGLIGSDKLRGDAGKDLLIGGESHDKIYGGAGDDTIYGASGSDDFYGLYGHDTIEGNDGNDLIYLDDPAASSVFVSAANGDIADGGLGNDTIYAGVTDDTLIGGEGNDTLIAEHGDDLVEGGIGNDDLRGGSGNDTLSGGVGNDSIWGDEGDFYGEENIFLGNDPAPIGYNDLINGGAGNDQLVGGAGNDTLYGEAGNDTLFGVAGSDLLDGGSGDDHLHAKLGSNTLIGGDGNDLLVGAEGSDNLNGGSGNDTLFGGLSADTLIGGLGNDLLKGGGGNDAVVGEGGNDELHGEEGNDLLSGHNGNDTLYGQAGADTLEGGLDDDYVEGGIGDDVVDGDEGNDEVYGGLGADTVRGGDGDDFLYGEDNDFEVTTGGGDLLEGGAGNDYIDGEAGADTLDGGSGDDSLLAGTGADSVSGGEGFDLLLGFEGADTLEGGNGNDVLRGGQDSDTIRGDAGDDVLFGDDRTASDTEGGDDLLEGGAGNDHLIGDFGQDTLRGGDNNDTLDGGYGEDVLEGGNGNDRFVYKGSEEVLFADQIDGGNGTDSIDLRAVDVAYTINGAGGDGTIDFIAATGGITTVTYENIENILEAGDTDGAGDKPVAEDDGDRVTLVDGSASASVSGDVLVNDSDPYATGGSQLAVTGLRAGRDSSDVAFSTVTTSQSVQGIYGVFTVNANGGFEYRVNSADPDVAAIIYSENEQFTYRITDADGLSDTAEIYMSVVRSNSAPEITFNGGSAPVLEALVVADPDIEIPDIILESTFSKVDGTDVAENVNGTNNAELINAGDGGDWITPGGGSDTIDGGDGRDMLSFVTLADTAGRTNTQYRLDLDLAEGTASTSGDDFYYIGSVERITGSIFADRIKGDAGDNELRGMGDYDWFVATTGADTIDGGTGQDMISYVDWQNDAANTADPFNPGGAPPPNGEVTGVVVDLNDTSNNTNLAAGHIYIDVERVTGSGRQDVFYGDGGENDFRGLGDYDWFVGSTGGRERYFGGDGEDTVTYFNSTSGVTASLRNGAIVKGEETGFGSAGDAARDLYFEIESLVGTNFVDDLTGNEGRNNLSGLDGDDFLYGFGGIDRLKGGMGDDYINGGARSDYALYDGNMADYVLNRTDEDRVIITGAEGRDTLIKVEIFVFADGEIAITDLPL